MKKLLFTTIAILLSLNSFAEATEIPVSEVELLETQQTSSWEYLGSTDYYRFTNEKAGTGSIYVRVISGKEFYQIRIKTFSGSIDSFNISVGDYNIRGRKYNAKFSATIFPDGSQDYYINL